MPIAINGGSGTGIKYFVASGTDTYTGSYSPYASYTAGDAFEVLFTNANTGASTLNINSLGALTLTKDGTTALVAGDIPAGSVHTVIVTSGTTAQLVPSSLEAATVAQINAGTDNTVGATPLNLQTSTYGAAKNVYLFNSFT